MEYVLKTNDLCKNYKHFKALNGLTMNVGNCETSSQS